MASEPVVIVEEAEKANRDLGHCLGRSHTESTQHESTNSPPPLYPMQQKNPTN